MRGTASSGEQTASAAHERDEARPGAFADDGAAFPVAEPGTFPPTISGRCPMGRVPGISPRRSSGPPLPCRRLPL